MQHPVDCFYAAVAALAGDGHIKQRLISAYQDNLEELDADDLPRSVQDRFVALKTQMHKVTPANGEGPICASVRKMSIDEASSCAESVVGLYAELERFRAAVQQMLPLSADNEVAGIVDGDRVTPPFLINTARQAG
ncbi:MAG: hypothetical protein AAFX56_10160 [Pseudomonadota bacterium]